MSVYMHRHRRQRSGCQPRRSTRRTPGSFGAALLAPVLALLFIACAPGSPRVIHRHIGPQPGASTAGSIVPHRTAGPLPAKTMTPDEIRAALRDIASRHQQGDTRSVREEYARKAEANPTLEARFLAAAAIADDDLSWEALRELTREQPGFYWAHAGIAAIYGRWGVRDQCERTLAIAAELRPDLGYTHTLRGLMHMNFGEYEEAAAAFDRALQVDPGDVDARVARALSRRALGDDSNLRAELERALRDWPTHYTAAVDLALLLDSAGDPGALQAWERVASIAPKHRHARLALARLRGQSDIAGAISALEEADALAPLQPTELTQLVELYRTAGRVDGEITALRRLISSSAVEPTHRHRLARLLEQQGDLEGAERTWRAVLELDGTDGEAHLGLGRVLESSDRIREAIESYGAALDTGMATAATEVQRLRRACLLPSRPIRGRSLTHLYRVVSSSLEKLYEQRKDDARLSQGVLRARLTTTTRGTVSDVEVLENSLGDPWIEAHLYLLLRDATWSRNANDPRRFTLTFDLPPVRE